MTLPPIAGVFADMASGQQKRDELADSLQLPVIQHKPTALPSGQFVVAIEADNSVALHFTGRGAPNPIRVDFLSGATAHRRQFGGGKSQLIAKAVGIKTRFRPHVLDLTAGLGQDAFVLATLGCPMTLVERVGVVFHLLKDGLDRALLSSDHDLRSIVSSMHLVQQNALNYLKAESSVDVIYLDPMFPERDKKAKVKKGMTAFHSIVGEDNDAGELLALALTKAKYRVVIKRPRKALSLAQQYPSLNLPKAGLVIEGKSSRYDIYPIAKMPDE
ncbi:MAG: class I SAM-dependent methyltransferase [Cellvibrionaceae bacterium]